MRLVFSLILAASTTVYACAQVGNGMPDLTQQQTYAWHLASSADKTGANADWIAVNPGETATVLDTDGPGRISHIWFTIDSTEASHLKRIVLRIFWDGEESPSVETPIGDFFGLGTGTYYAWQSEMLSVGNSKALNCFFPMPYRRHARITVTNEGKVAIRKLYFGIEYRTQTQLLPADTLYFHAQFRQAQPNQGWTLQPLAVHDNHNLTGKDNYVWLDAKGHGQFVGVTMSVLQNQDGWWGEGDPMFFIDGAVTPMGGTGAEDYFLGAWGFGSAFSYQLYGAPQVGTEFVGGRSSVYRFHLDSPIPFTKSIKATIEHGNANNRSDSYYSVAYWYQAEPHAAFPPLPPVNERIPTVQMVDGPGYAPAGQPSTGLSPQ
jgi:Protein of unknown function (DUF2961)